MIRPCGVVFSMCVKGWRYYYLVETPGDMNRVMRVLLSPLSHSDTQTVLLQCDAVTSDQSPVRDIGLCNNMSNNSEQ